MRICKHCNLEKCDGDYYKRSNGKPNYSKCKECTKEYNRNYSSSTDQREKRRIRQSNFGSEKRKELLQYSRDYYATKYGRAKSMMKTVNRRSDKFEQDTNLTFEDIHEMLVSQSHCSVTGIEFDYSRPTKTKKNPYAPSLDRIDPNTGYIHGNVRLVIWQYNLMKGEISDKELLKICKGIVDGSA